jgi:PKD repeat protein
MVLILSAATVWALPEITILDVKTVSQNGVLNRDFRIGEKVTYKIGYEFHLPNYPEDPPTKTVTGKVTIQFADGSCLREYEKIVSNVTADEGHWMVIRRKIPACSSVGNWVMVTYSIKVGVSEASETGAIFVYPPLEPIARFSARPRYGEKPLKVYFTNKSLGTVDTFTWGFGGDPDGVLDPHSPDHSPIYTYKTPGTYSVTLGISGPDGSDSKTKTDYITVVDPATVLDANFRAPRSERSVVWEDTPVTVNFEDTSIGTPTHWHWDFSYDEDDGFNDESTDQDPSHDYTEPGLYSVVLKVSNASLEDQKTKLNYIYIYEE